MGGMHPAEYFAESILSPNAVILEGPGYSGPDGTSIMPGYADSLSVTQLVDLVAFLKGLTGGGHEHGAAPVEKTRSEEHTSELQSHHDLVCRLLLEKKKKKKQNIINNKKKKKKKKKRQRTNKH